MRTKRAAFEKVVHLGYVKGTYQGFARNHPVFCKIAFKAEGERGCLSISGVVGPRTHGHCESCGQIVGTRLDELAPGWDAATVGRFYELWDRWHLNDLRAGCEHQRAEGWGRECLEDGRWTGHVYPKEHPRGVLCKPCPVCGYRYGTEWKYEEVPDDVLDFFRALPEPSIAPVWV